MTGLAAAAVAGETAPLPTTIESTGRILEPLTLICAGVSLVAAIVGLSVLPYAAAAVALLALLSSIAASRGRLVFGPTNLTGRYLFRTVTVDWNDVWGLDVEAGFVHRFVQLRRRDGRRFALPALRAVNTHRSAAFEAGISVLEQWSLRHVPSGVRVRRPHRYRSGLYTSAVVVLLATTVLFDRPWYWPSAPSVAELPAVCTVLTTGPAAKLGFSAPAVATADQAAGLAWRACGWVGDVTVRLGLVRFDRVDLINGSGVASARIDDAERLVGRFFYTDEGFRHEDRVTASDGTAIGDESYMDMSDVATQVVARRANVVVVVVVEAASGANLPESAAHLAVDAVADAVSHLYPA